MPTPSTVSTTVAVTAYSKVTRALAQNAGSVSTSAKLRSPMNTGRGTTAA